MSSVGVAVFKLESVFSRSGCEIEPQIFKYLHEAVVTAVETGVFQQYFSVAAETDFYVSRVLLLAFGGVSGRCHAHHMEQLQGKSATSH